MIRIVVWEDINKLSIDLVTGIRQAAARANIRFEVRSYCDHWHLHAVEEIHERGEQFWLADIFVEDQQEEVKDFSGWMKSEIKVDKQLSEAFGKCNHILDFNNGLGIGVLARKYGIPIRFVSQYSGKFAKLLEIFAGSFGVPARGFQEHAFDKSLLDLELDLPDAMNEYDRIIKVVCNIFSVETKETTPLTTSNNEIINRRRMTIRAIELLIDKIDENAQSRRSGLESTPGIASINDELKLNEKHLEMIKLIYEYMLSNQQSNLSDENRTTLNELGKKYFPNTWQSINLLVPNNE